LGLVCAFVIGIFAWGAESGVLELASPRTEDSYYNLLVQGFQAGQLNVKREAPQGLAKLSDPYDPAFNDSFVWDKDDLAYEMSYYKGKLYLYFGVTPALVLFWPYEILTGHYLFHRNAVVIFFSLGFLAAAGLLRAIWKRYFPDTGAWITACGLLAMGLATGILEVLPACDVYEVAKSCAFAFTMLALAGIWGALHDAKRPALWLLLASVAYGLAIGSRPLLLFGAIILLIPLARAWKMNRRGSGPRLVILFMAVMGPMLLVGSGLMLYNDLRFDSPFEFGWHYQLTNYNNHTARQLSFHYWFGNFLFYFIEPMRWSGHFPYLQAATAPSSSPAGYYGTAAPFSGILCNYPVTWLALASPLAWRNRPEGDASGIRWFIAALFLLFVTCAGMLCLFFAGASSYELDFLPALMLLAVIGILGMERTLADLPKWRRLARTGWSLLLAYTIAFNVLAAVEARATADYFAGNSLIHQGHFDEAVQRLQTAAALKPDSASIHLALGIAYSKMGWQYEGIDECQKALEIDPKFAEAYYDLGNALIQAGQEKEGFEQIEKALEIAPDFAATHFAAENNNLAWSMATNPDASKRNGPLAVKLAEGACRNTHYQKTVMVGTLAAAYAEAGRFDDAITTAQKACELAAKSGDKKLLKSNQDLLALYLKHQPYHAEEEAAPQ
jgi:tetratricopeptide (TPR) repeat protein